MSLWSPEICDVTMGSQAKKKVGNLCLKVSSYSCLTNDKTKWAWLPHTDFSGSCSLNQDEEYPRSSTLWVYCVLFFVCENHFSPLHSQNHTALPDRPQISHYLSFVLGKPWDGQGRRAEVCKETFHAFYR